MRCRIPSLALVSTLALVAASCTDQVSAPLTAPVRVIADRDAGSPQNFQTHLTGEAEVPVRATDAQGNAKFQLSRDGQSIEYKVIASNIENAFMAHIHLGPSTGTGGIVVWLRPVPPSGVPAPETQARQDGIFAEGTFTQADFVGALRGRTMADLLAQIRAGNAYVNVHTRNLAIPASQLQPGNYPGGEVRGQIDHGNGMH